jgi:predicted RNase H-like nuclease (RuvC/YqgF family)
MSHPAASYRSPRKPGSLLPPRPLPPQGVNRLDHYISLQNGSTSALELSSQRIQLSKQKRSLNLSTRVEELTKELGHLRHEIQFYRQSFENLQRLRGSCYDIYQQLFLAFYLDREFEHLQELMARLHQALEKSLKSEAIAEKDWMEFWGINDSEKNLVMEFI